MGTGVIGISCSNLCVFDGIRIRFLMFNYCNSSISASRTPNSFSISLPTSVISLASWPVTSAKTEVSFYDIAALNSRSVSTNHKHRAIRSPHHWIRDRLCFLCGSGRSWRGVCLVRGLCLGGLRLGGIRALWMMLALCEYQLEYCFF